jgi:lipid A 3-O-deacylase
MRARGTRPILFVTLALTLLPGTAGAEEGSSRHAGSLSVGVGTFNTGHTRPSTGVGLEYRLDSRAWRPRASSRFSLVPTFGVTGTSRNAFFVYAGLRTDAVARTWRITPGFAVGAYSRNGDIDLGGPVEFRSSLDISRALNDRVRLGVTFYHISNARLYDRNPGVNALAFIQTF